MFIHVVKEPFMGKMIRDVSHIYSVQNGFPISLHLAHFYSCLVYSVTLERNCCFAFEEKA